jgi:ribosomal protein S19
MINQRINIIKSKYIKSYFCTKSNDDKDNLNTKKRLYGYVLRDKFMEICKANLISKVLNKTENGQMLLRSDIINASHVGKTYAVYNGMTKYALVVTANMVGFKVGEFVYSRTVKNLNGQKLKTQRYDLHMKEVAVKLKTKKKKTRSNTFTFLKKISNFNKDN